MRIVVLLAILAFVALNTYFDRLYSTDWDAPLRVALYPINADGGDVTERFVRGIKADDFVTIERFFAEEAAAHGAPLETPVRFELGPQLREAPPALDPDAGPLGVAAWSLRARWWAWRTPEGRAAPDIKLFLLYYDPRRSPALPHSTGLRKGLFGVVHVFADQRMLGSNDVVIAHELLHTLGASDKYERGTNLPLHPEGYAEPDREPLHPQTHAELMAGRIPLSPDEADTPESLRYVVVGPRSAAEIGWSKP
ncbi:MAG: hypothetical protein RBS02_01100 [Steroidobacteraceae bacterium]|nr:hypothetical protein [Steroidobacteraceae bacterium]